MLLIIWLQHDLIAP